MADGIPFNIKAGTALQPYWYEVEKTVRTIGVAGAVVATTSSSESMSRASVRNSVINTTTDLDWAITSQFSGASSSTTIQQEVLTIQKIV